MDIAGEAVGTAIVLALVYYFIFSGENRVIDYIVIGGIAVFVFIVALMMVASALFMQ